MVSAAPPTLRPILIIVHSPPQGAQKEHGWVDYVAPTCNFRDALGCTSVAVCVTLPTQVRWWEGSIRFRACKVNSIDRFEQDGLCEVYRRAGHTLRPPSLTVQVKTQCTHPVTSDRSFNGRRELPHGFDIIFADPKPICARAPVVACW